MTAEVMTARPAMTLKEVARETAAHRVCEMLVFDEGMRVIGVI
jgi:hypothetical protein